MSTVSVILTSFNHAAFIAEAIESVLQQSFTDFELIIWDDASVDDSWAIIQSYSDPRIRAFRNDINKGPVFGINKAISEIATGDYIAMHHSDDVWVNDKLQKQVAFLESHQAIGAVFSNAFAINERSLPLDDTEHFYSHIFDKANRTRHEWLRFFFNDGNALCHPSLLIRKQCYQDCGLYRPMLAQVPDFDMWIRLCLQYEIHVLPERLVNFRVRDNEANTSGDRPDTRIRGFYENYKLLSNYQRIRSFEELISVFPEASQYERGEASSIDFALAMLALEKKAVPFMVLFAQEVLFAAISEPTQAAQLKQAYDFDYLRFIQLSAQCDIFSCEELTKLWKEIAARDKDIAQLNQHIADQHHQIEQIVADYELRLTSIQQSSSWKITAPLRFFARCIKRCLGQGKA